MHTSYGKLAVLGFCLLLAYLLLAPMRAGQEDQLMLSPAALRMSVGDSYTVRCALASDAPGQSLKFDSSDVRVASISGSILGAFILGVLMNGLNLLNVNQNWQTFATGMVVIIAVWVDKMRTSERT